MTALRTTRLCLALGLSAAPACKRAPSETRTSSEPTPPSGPLATPPAPPDAARVAPATVDAAMLDGAAVDGGGASVDAGAVVQLRWTSRDLPVSDAGDPRAFITLDLSGAVTAHLTLGEVDGGNCNDGSDALAPDDHRTLARLSCYYAGYGQYVDVLREPQGIRLVAYGMAEALPGRENPPHEHNRVLGRFPAPPDVQVTLVAPPDDSDN